MIIRFKKNCSTSIACNGLGFDKLVRWCTGMENIRDVVHFQWHIRNENIEIFFMIKFKIIFLAVIFMYIFI